MTDRERERGGGSAFSQRRDDQIETLKSVFEDLHFGSSLQCAEHLANLFKEKQITPRVKEHGGTLVKTLYVSLRCSLSLLFEGRFLYNNILNQSLNSLSSKIVTPPCWLSGNDITSLISFSADLLTGKVAKWCKQPGGGG